MKAIKSFVIREGRMSARQGQALEAYWADYGLAFNEALLDFEQIFGRRAPTVLEIGFGMGNSLLQMASAQPELNFVGIEVHRPGIGNLFAGLKERNLANVRVINHDAVEVLKTMVAPGSLAGLQLFFPDPWPKRRHHKRRLLQKSFIDILLPALQTGGFIHCATDWAHYAHHMMRVLSEHEALINSEGANQFATRPRGRPETKFEARGIRLGHGVWDVLFTTKS